MALTAEGTYFGEGVIWIQGEKNFSVEEMTILSGEDLDTLNIIGRIENAVPTTGTITGTGDGTFTSVTGGKGVKVGAYLLTCVEAFAGGGLFELTDPFGDLVERSKITAGALTVPTTGTADGGNTGNGTVTSVTGDAATVPGTYNIECVETVTNGGVFIVRVPNGDVIDRVEITAGAGGTATVANNQINATITDGSTDFAESDFFTITVIQANGGTGTLANNEVSGTITDGATDFIVGDYFTITVAAGSLKGVELDTTATDGSQVAYGILINTTDASLADTQSAVVVRDALIIADSLDWPAGISAGNKAIALTELKAKNIIERTEVV